MRRDAQPGIAAYYSWILSLFFVASFIYLLEFVNPGLIFQHQQPVFFTGAEFFRQHLQYPGGITEYVSSFLSQFYRFPALGALLITLVIAGITVTAFSVNQIFYTGKAATFAALLLAGVLLGMHSSYYYKLSFSLALLFPLLAFLLFIKLAKRSLVLRVALYPVFSSLLYYIAAAPFFVFIILGIMAEFFLQREKWTVKIIVALAFGGLGGLWPIVAHDFIFLYSAKDRYTFLLPFNIYSSIKVLPEVIYLLILLCPFVLALPQLIKKFQKVEQRKTSAVRNVVVLCICFIAMCVVASFSLDRRYKIVLQIDQMAEAHDWKQILTTARSHSDVLHRLVTLHYNRALYHTGQLCENLFGYPQIEGEDGLYRNSGPTFDSPFAMAVLCFEMGNPNSAQSWANEAISIEGESARVLKQLALIHIQKHEFATAAIYLNKLSRTLFDKQWANFYRNLMHEPSKIQSDPLFINIESPPVSSNFLIRYGYAYAELKYLSEKSPQNKMAFEYYMAYNLLARRLDRFIELLPHFMQMPYSSMPRHVEEAVILIGMSGVKHNINLDTLQFRKDYVDGFQKFMSIIAKHNKNMQFAQAELAREFGDTYWYYHLYHQPQELEK